jgi:hypothetical protein
VVRIGLAGFVSRFTEVEKRLLPGFTPDEMVCEFLTVLREPLLIQFFHRQPNRCMELSPSAAEETVIGGLLSQDMLEDILQIGEHALLVDKLQVFERTEAIIELLLDICDAPQQEGCEFPPDHRCGLDGALVLLDRGSIAHRRDTAPRCM